MDTETRQNAPALDDVVAAMRRKKYVVFDDARGHDANIVGIRSGGDADAFDDYIALFYRTRDAWSYFAFPATTDPGTYYRENPVNVNGTAILKPGQYRRAFAMGTHRDYPALVQVEPVTVYRDANRDGALDIENAPEETGMFDIHIHRAGATPANLVGRWSAGCQVFQDAAQFDFFKAQCGEGATKSHFFALTVSHAISANLFFFATNTFSMWAICALSSSGFSGASVSSGGGGI